MLPSDPNYQIVADFAGVFTNPLRLAILRRLVNGPCIVNDMVHDLGITQAVISKQLGVLRAAGLIACQPDGRCRKYQAANPELLSAFMTKLGETAGFFHDSPGLCPDHDINNKSK